jgi:prophage regulatory protein
VAFISVVSHEVIILKNNSKSINSFDIKQLVGVMSPLNVIRLPKLKVKLDISKSSVYSWLDPKSPNYDPTFPKPIRLGAKAVAWVELEIDEWLEMRIKSSRNANRGVK